jgi:hypothetical protein
MVSVLETVALYYGAWHDKRGDFGVVPLADGFEFIGPVASFDSAEGYRAMAREAGQAVTSFAVRRQFVDGNTVCSIIASRRRSKPATSRASSPCSATMRC